MRKIAGLFAVCLMLVFSGCHDNTLDKQGSSGDSNTIAVIEQTASYENTPPAPKQSADGEISESTEDFNNEWTEQPASDETATSAAGQDVNQLSDDDIVEIRERMFIAQLNDIYLNQNDYIGKTIKYEGMFTSYTWEEMGLSYYLVYRQSPGCCGADGQAGFEVVWPDGSNEAYPNENDWCEVMGTLDSYDEDGYSYLHIVLDSITVKSERGAEFVSQ